mgnify:CR=1 FL=1
MKKFILLIFVLFPLVVSAQRFTYTKRAATPFTFSDFRLGESNEGCQAISGSIYIGKRQLFIDGEEFIIKKIKADNFIKTNKGHIKIIAQDNRLACVQVLRYNTLLTYYIENNQAPDLATVYHKSGRNEGN